MIRNLSIVAALLLSQVAFAEEIALRWRIDVDPVDYFKVAAEEFKKSVETRSHGKIRVQLEFVPHDRNRNIFHHTEVVRGDYDMGQAVTFELANIAPVYRMWDLPFLFASDDHVDRYLASNHSRKSLEDLRQHGIVAFGQTYSGGLLSIYGEKMDSFADVRGKKFASEASSPSWKETLEKKWGSTVAPLDHEAFAQNPERGTYGEITESVVSDLFPLAGKHPLVVNQTYHRVLSRILFVSKGFYEKLSPQLQKIVWEEGVKAAKYERQLSIEDSKRKLAELQNKGITLNIWSTEKRQSERKRFQSLYSDFRRTDSEAVILVDSLLFTPPAISSKRSKPSSISSR